MYRRVLCTFVSTGENRYILFRVLTDNVIFFQLCELISPVPRCVWVVHKDGVYVINQLERETTWEHSDHCSAMNSFRSVLKKDDIKQNPVAQAAVRSNPHLRAPRLRNLLNELVPGQLPSERSIRRALYEMRQHTSVMVPSKNPDYDYQFIPGACKKFQQENPGSIAVCDTNTSVMEEYFNILDNDGSDFISQTKLMNAFLGKNGYSESDLKKIILDMNLDTPESPISKNSFLTHFAGKFRRFAVIFRPQVIRVIR